MSELSEDEFLVMVGSFATLMILWGRLLLMSSRLGKRLRASSFARNLLFGLPAVIAIALTAMLKSWADVAVREMVLYQIFYVFLGLAWVGVAMWLLGRLGLSLRDDVLERNNVAAAIAIYGLCVALTFAYAGGNFGDGPGWWVVVFTAGLGTASLAVLWIVFNKLTWIVDRITIDRDVGAALHAALLCTAWGVVCMRSAAGNWVDVFETVVDFAPGYLPMLAMFVFAVVVERIIRPLRAPGSRSLAVSLLAGLVEVGGAIGWVVWRGWW